MASSNQQPIAAVASLDSALGFTIPARHARGRLVRLGPVLEEILSAYDPEAAIPQRSIRTPTGEISLFRLKVRRQ